MAFAAEHWRTGRIGRGLRRGAIGLAVALGAGLPAAGADPVTLRTLAEHCAAGGTPAGSAEAPFEMVETFHASVFQAHGSQRRPNDCVLTGWDVGDAGHVLQWVDVEATIRSWIGRRLTDDATLRTLRTEDGLIQLLRLTGASVALVASAGSVGALTSSLRRDIRLPDDIDPDTFFFHAYHPERTIALLGT